MDYAHRLRTVSAHLSGHKIDRLLLTHLPNIRYLCGFTGSAAALLLGGAEPIFFSDGRYTAQAQAEVQGARVVIAPKSPLVSAADWLNKSRRGGSLGIESEHLTVAAEARLRSSLPNRIKLRPVSGLIERQRMVKDAAEIERIRRAVKLGSSLLLPTIRTIRPGVPTRADHD